ncbi:MAG: DUF2156 domain-containing protein [Gemmatimonadota bacterium]|nr:MAG: DUF2156 domain-containing protein [Gemmatimonadota bacterium]
MQPEFPTFKPVEIDDRDFITRMLWEYQPETSELTFTNLYIWRSHYGIEWSMCEDWLLVLFTQGTQSIYALMPAGPPSRLEVCRLLLQWLENERGVEDARIERADLRLISEIESTSEFLIEPIRDHFDYVYRSQDLIQLSGNKYHSKRNHINKFRQAHIFGFERLGVGHLQDCLDMAETWCQRRRCEEDMNLMGEWEAVREALIHYAALKLRGGVIPIEGRVGAFALGELLNDRTAVVHIEKANPEIRGLYAMINQKFCEEIWGDVPYVNREQDLGEPGLRAAKLSYHPHHLEEKFRVRLRN